MNSRSRPFVYYALTAVDIRERQFIFISTLSFGFMAIAVGWEHLCRCIYSVAVTCQCILVILKKVALTNSKGFLSLIISITYNLCI